MVVQTARGMHQHKWKGKKIIAKIITCIMVQHKVATHTHVHNSREFLFMYKVFEEEFKAHTPLLTQE